MTYWHETMHDDVALIMISDWQDAARPRKTVEDKDRKLSETLDLTIGSGRKAEKYKMDLIPPSLIVARYFATEQAKVDELNAALEAATAATTEHSEEYGGEEASLSEATNDKGAYTKQLLSSAIKEAKEAADDETLKLAKEALSLVNAEADTKKAAKVTQAALDLAVFKKYGELTVPEIKTLVLDDKWHATVANRVTGEVDALTQDLVARIQQLGERYAETVGDLGTELEKLAAKVAGHLAAMGVDL